MPTGLRIHRGVFFFQFHHFEGLINNKKQKAAESFTAAYTCTKCACGWNTYCSEGRCAWAQQGEHCRHCLCHQLSWHFCTGTHRRNPVCLQATQRALTHRKPSHRGVLGKMSDGLGKEADSIKGELKFSKERNWEFNEKRGIEKTWNQRLVVAGKWRRCWMRRESHRYRKQSEE